mgnify:CR=1 FL=1
MSTLTNRSADETDVASDTEETTDTRYAYDALNRLDVLTQFIDDGNGVYDGTEALVATFDYEVEVDGQRSGVVEASYDAAGNPEYANVFAWSYDNAGRLVEERLDATGTADDFVAEYSFDLVGNRLKKEVDTDTPFSAGTIASTTPATLRGIALNGPFEETTDYQYDANDRLSEEIVDKPGTSDDRNTVYTYNGTVETGNTVRAGTNPGSGEVQSTTVNAYNVRGRLGQVVIEEYESGVVTLRKTSSFEYNDDGMRVRLSEKTEIDGDGNSGTPLAVESDETTLHLLDKQNHTGYAQILEEIEQSSGTVQASYVLGHDIVAQWAAAEGLAWLVYDGLASTRMLMNAGGLITPAGGVAQRFLYEAYGRLVTPRRRDHTLSRARRANRPADGPRLQPSPVSESSHRPLQPAGSVRRKHL